MQSLIPLNKSRTSFEGFIDNKGKSYRIRIDLKESNELENARLSCDWRLRHCLRKHLGLLQQRLKQCLDLNQFMSELQSLLDHTTEEKSEDIWQPKYYDTILTHLQDLGWDKVKSVSDDFRKIELRVNDGMEREHSLSLSLTPQYPNEPPSVTAILPCPFQPLWSSKSDLQTIFNQFAIALQQYERLWDEVDELRQYTWILEPENPNFAAVSFRLALGTTCSMQVKLDPFNAGALPECHFLGADWAISPIQDKFHNKLEDWNESLSVYQNLKILLEIDFPPRQAEGSQDMTLQCGICYAYRLETDIPDQICNDKRCGQAFHHQCLLEWIKSIPGAKQSFNVIFGECPYCTSLIKLNILSNSH